MSGDQQHFDKLPLAGCNILLVEDDLNAKELIVDILKVQGGAKVNATTTAKEALALLIQLKPDVLISNILLPEEDGYQLIQKVRHLAPEQGRQIPAIAITASANEFNRKRLLEAGFQAYFFKPFEPDELILKIIELTQCDQAKQ